MSEIIVVMTCHNRKDKTINCIKKLHEGNNCNIYHYIVVDAASTDNTVESIAAMEYEDVDIINAFQGSDAIDIFKKLTVVGEKGE